MLQDDYIRQLGGLMVWRCTEAIDPRSGFIFRTIGNPDGRCIEIVHASNQMLFDRRLAIQIARAILDIAGPDEELASDVAQSTLVEVVYVGRSSEVAGFRPYEPRTGSNLTDADSWIRQVRRDAGLPEPRLRLEPTLPEEDIPDAD